MLVSSHILSEIQQMADRVAIFSHGRTVASGPVTSFLTDAEAPGLLVRLTRVDDAIALLAAAELEAAATDEAGTLVVSCAPPDGERVARVLADGGIYPREMVARGAALEAAYLRLTSDGDGRTTPVLPQEAVS